MEKIMFKIFVYYVNCYYICTRLKCEYNKFFYKFYCHEN